MKGLLRSLIVAEIGLGIACIVVSSLTESSLPEPLRTYLEAEAEAEITTRDNVMLATAIPFVMLWLVSIVGLYFVWRPARTLYLIATVLGLLAPVFLGPYIYTGWEAMFEEAALVVSGVILALIYFSPLSDLYESPESAAHTTQTVGRDNQLPPN